MASPDGSDELDLNCQKCGGPYRLVWDRGPTQENVWYCPRCGHAHRSSLQGAVTDVILRPKPH